MTNQIIECCVSTLEDSLEAIKNGANRIEYCASLDKDGLTPSVSEIKNLLGKTNIPIRVMIRPENSFYVSSQELKIMKQSINDFSSLPIDGVVFGMLNENNRIHIEQIKHLLEVSQNIPVTFHKAIDDSSDIIEDVKILNQFPQIDYILSSGGHKTAWEGRETLIKMRETFNKNIIAAGSITKNNLDKTHKYLNLNAYHGKRIVG